MKEAEAAAGLSKDEAEALLGTLVRDFSGAPLANGKKMRDLLMWDQEAFGIAAVSVLRDVGEVRGCRYLVTLLWSNNLLIPTLSDTTLPKELCLRVARTAAKVDPQLHIRLTRFLVAGMLEGHELEEHAASRLLEVLSEIADAAGIQPFLRKMLLHPNSRIRSKITLLVGRGHACLHALEKLLADEDPRVRANAIEAIWPNHDPQAQAIMRAAAKDENNRVAGNALLGLHMAGDTHAIPAMLALASNPTAVYRATAAWIMGRTKDPRFLPTLGKLLAESKGQLRKTVFNAIESLKRAGAKRNEPNPLSVTILDARDSPPTSISLYVAVSSKETELPEVKATEFLIGLGAELVAEFSCVEQRNDLVCVGFIIPRRSAADDPLRSELEKSLKKCLAKKKRPEQWTLARYRELPRTEPSATPTRLLGQSLSGPQVATKQPDATFTANATALQASIEATGLRLENAVSLGEALQSVLALPLPSRAARHLIVIADSVEFVGNESVEEIAGAAKKQKISIHAVCLTRNAYLTQLAAETSGMCRVLSHLDELEPELQTLYQSLKRRYLIEFERAAVPAGEATITVQVHAAAFGEGTWKQRNGLTEAAESIPEKPAQAA